MTRAELAWMDWCTETLQLLSGTMCRAHVTELARLMKIVRDEHRAAGTGETVAAATVASSAEPSEDDLREMAARCWASYARIKLSEARRILGALGKEEWLNHGRRREALTAYRVAAERRPAPLSESAECDRLRTQCRQLWALVGGALPIVQSYALRNPKQLYYGGEQDPNGAHEWLQKYAALSSGDPTDLTA